MLIVDGIRYNPYKHKNEDELERYIEEQAKNIFGNDSLYFSVKTRLKSISGIGSIPDAYAINLISPQNWFLIEVEMSTHSIFNHIVPQLNKFVQGLKDPRSRRIIVEALYNEIKEDPVTEAYVRTKIGSGEIFRFLSSVIDKPPILVVIIDEKTIELDEACSSIPIAQKEIVVFKTYQRVDTSLRNAHEFNSITSVKVSTTPIKPSSSKSSSPTTPQSAYSIPILESLVELGGEARVPEVLDIVFKKMKNKFAPADLEQLPSGREPRWRNQTKWERFNLKEKGLLKSDSPHGIWEISSEGRKRLEEQRS